MERAIKAITLAAGKGSRMQSELPKVLHKIAGKPMVNYLLDTLDSVTEIEEIILVLGHEKEKVIAQLGDKYKYVFQEEQLGTGHAVKVTKNEFLNFNGNILITYGDCPLLSKKTIEKLIEKHNENNVVCTMLTAHLDNPTGYGRIVKKDGYITSIVEELDATPEIREIKEVNSGVYLVNAQMLFKALDLVKNDNVKKEYYLTDIISIFVSKGLKINSYMTPDILEIQGVNTQPQLEYVESVLKSRQK